MDQPLDRQGAEPIARVLFIRGTHSFLLVVSLGLIADLLAESPAIEAPIQSHVQAASPPPPRSPIAAAIAAGLPKYQVSEPTAVPVANTGDDPVLLPTLVVRNKALPTFSESEIHTRLGLGYLLIKRYAGESLKTQYVGDPHTVNYALQSYQDDERLRVRRTWDDFADILLRSGDLKGSRQLKQDLDDATLRRFDWRTEAIDRSVNNGRR